MSIFINAFMMVFFAEMGDKSQIMAMSFAAKYPLKKVAMGIFIGIAVNHGLAVAVGYLLGKMLPVNLIGIIAGLLFLYFGLMSFKLEDDDASSDKPNTLKLSIVNTIALAFFLGEFGDKTQLTATALASTTASPLIVFAGTFTAMLATSSLGIAVGSLLGSKLPEHFIKGVSGTVFLLFGTQKLFEQVEFLQSPIIAGLYSVILGGLAFVSIKPLYLDWRSGRLSPMQKAAQHLKDMQSELKHLAEGLCIGTAGPNGCQVCRESGCIVGQTKILIGEMKDHSGPTELSEAIADLEYAVDRQFNLDMAIAGLELLERFESENDEAYQSYRPQIEPIESRLKELAKSR